MNLQQLIEEINKDLDDTLEDEDLIGWINRCMDELSPYATFQKNAVISLAIGQKEYDLPNDYLRLKYLVDEYPLDQVRMKDFVSVGFKLWGNKLIFQPTPTTEKDLDLYYEGKLPYLSKPEDEPQIPSQFHDLFILYTVAKARYQDEEESLQMNAWNEYKKRKEDFITFMFQSIEPSAVEDVYGI